MNIRLSVLRQLLIFGLYFIFCSLFLFNHKGGADILFMMLITGSSFIHVIVTIVKISRSESENPKKWTMVDLVVLAVILVLFFLMLPHYMDFMWQLTK